MLMAELEDILQSVMSSPESMSKIMDIVQMFGGEADKREETQPQTSAPVSGIGDSVIDPVLVSKIMGLINNYNAGDDRRIRLLGAIRPYLKDQDSFHIDRAIQIVKLSRVAKSVLHDFLK